MDKRLFLLDAYALIFRAYYALIKMPRITQAGFNTSAIFGFVNTLEEILRKENPTHIAVCFDPAGPTFRSEAYGEYKGERAATPEDIKLSVPIIKEIVKAYRIPVVEVEGFEADDVIGTLARMAEAEGFTTYMMTPDKDFGQLVSPRILQYKPSYRGQDFELRGEEEVCAKYGIDNTRQVIDLLALMGDKIDNIPGCPGVGEVTAVKLIKEFGSVENLIANTDRLKGAIKKKVEENVEQIKFSKFLATIRTDAPVNITPAQLERHAPDTDKLFAIFRELEFKTLMERVSRRLGTSAASSVADAVASTVAAPATPATTEKEIAVADFSHTDYRIADSSEILDALDWTLATASRCAIAMITDGDNDFTAEWHGTAVATAEGKAYYIPASNERGCALILDLMARADIVKISADCKRDMVTAFRRRSDDATALVNYGDISLAHYLLQPEMRHRLEELSTTYLGHTMRQAPDFKKSRKPKSLFESDNILPAEEIYAYACEAADVVLRIEPILIEALKDEKLFTLYTDVELPLVAVLADMEITGVRIDTRALKMAEKDMISRLENIETDVYSLAGVEFNIGSPAKVGEVLFDRLQLDPKAKKTKTGQYSTSEDVLEKLTDRHPIVAKILEYRALKKLLSTYVSALPATINPLTGKIHTNYNQTVTATGRLSSSAPNLQNIPVRDNEGREIRRAFIPDAGSLFLSADYSQIELRLLADFSQDEIMIDAFRHGKDIHAITASKIYHKNQDEVTADERRNAKTANFGIVYGISAFGLASRLNIPRAEAKEIIDNYFATFPTVKKYMADSVEHAREKGYVLTRMGRKRALPDINSRNPVVRGYAERNAINAPLQGTAADIIKVAMIRIYAEMKRRGLKSKMIMQVHDELNFNVPAEEVAVMQELVPRLMQESYEGAVPLTASCGVAENWLEAH